MTNDERLKERREGAALMLEAWANGEDMLESTRRYYLELAEGYRAGRWDADLSKGTKGMNNYAINWLRIHTAATIDLFRYYQDSRIADKPFEHYGAVVAELKKRGVVGEDCDCEGGKDAA